MNEQVCFFSATLHSPEIARLSERICDRPTWVDLKGVDSVPETVHHVVVRVDPDKHRDVLMREGGGLLAGEGVGVVPEVTTDGAAVGVGPEGREEEKSERLKRLKPQVLLSLQGAFVRYNTTI